MKIVLLDEAQERFEAEDRWWIDDELSAEERAELHASLDRALA